MKIFLEKIWKKILLTLVRAHIKRYKPFIIGVTGSVGKTSTREAIAAVAGSQKFVRTAAGSLNNEFGFALTILGNWDEEYFDQGSSVGLWLRVFFAGLVGLLFRKNRPELFILEYGADRPGDIKKLTKAVKPHIAVVTSVGDVPVHVEFFSGPEGVAKEKSLLVEALEPTGFAILNFDDSAVLDMKEKTKAHIITFGFGEGAGIKISSFDHKTDNAMPIGVSFKLHHGLNSFVPVNINGSLGKSQAWAAAAAAAVGIATGMNLVEISNALSYYDGPKGRLKIIAGVKNSWIIDDTYNASPASTRLALAVLRELLAKRRIAVLGDMLELGKYTIEAHRAIGDLAGRFVDLLICVGSRAKFIADAAANQIALNINIIEEAPQQGIYTFETSDMAKKSLRDLIREGDLVLVKGSQGMRMEKIVEEIMAEPEKKKELLVRQSKKWSRLTSHNV